jgi:hypothetical protein
LSIDWGCLPAEIYAKISGGEWTHLKHRQQRLTGERPFPLSVPLKPPTDVQAVANLAHFQVFVSAWQQFSQPELIQWQHKQYRTLRTQEVPVRLEIPSMQVLLEYLGNDALQQSRLWEARMAPLIEYNKAFYPVLIRHLPTLEQLSAADVLLLVALLPQLTAGMGRGLYLRALPFVGVDTKFLESNAILMGELLGVLYGDAIVDAGGLEKWLGCEQRPSGWVFVRPLCERVRAAMGGFAILQLPTNELLSSALPAENILVVENLQSGLALPNLDNTLAVCGGGRNVAWMAAPWLRNKRLGYWGDLDTWGLAILSHARALAPHVESIMMDEKTWEQFAERRVAEPDPYAGQPACLSDAELSVFQQMQEAGGVARLEQERLSPDYCSLQLELWAHANAYRRSK